MKWNKSHEGGGRCGGRVFIQMYGNIQGTGKKAELEKEKARQAALRAQLDWLSRCGGV